MNRPVDYLALVLAALALLCWLGHLFRNRRVIWHAPLVVTGAVLALLAAGSQVPFEWAFWLAVAASFVLVGLVVVLMLTGDWWPPVVWGVVALLMLTIGGLGLGATARGLMEAGQALGTAELLHPWWLLLILVLPGLLALAVHNLGFVTKAERQWFWRWVFPLVGLLPLVWVTLLAAGLVWRGGRLVAAYPELTQGQRVGIILGAVGVGLLPLLVFLGWYLGRVARRLKQDSWRPWISLALRSALVVFLTLALAEPRLRQMNENTTVLFVVDRSQSIPEEFDDNQKGPAPKVDRRAERILKFINKSVEKAGKSEERSQAGLIVFGRRPRLELPPSAVARFNLKELPPATDGNYTDIAAALKLALASFPEGTGKRIVLVSDGNENLGSAEEQGQFAKSLGVQIDVVPLAAGQRNEDEVLVERVEAPPLTEQGANVPIRVLVRSFNPGLVVVDLTLKQITEKEREIGLRCKADGSLGGVAVQPIPGERGVRITDLAPDSPLAQARFEKGDVILKVDNSTLSGAEGVTHLLGRRKPNEALTLLVRQKNTSRVVGELKETPLQQGLNSFSFTRPLTDEQRSYTYEAEIQPRGFARLVEGKLKFFEARLRGDRVQNNRASTHVVARGQRRILLLENRPDGKQQEVANQLLLEKLRAAGDRKFRVDVRPIEVLNNYPDRDKLAVFLGDYDCIILDNVPAEKVSDDQQEALRSNTQDGGSGLVMVGGPDAFGAGGWQNTTLEKALPVDCEIKSLKVQGKGGLVLIMHASEMADGNMWQKKIAKLAIERLGPGDMVGVIFFDFQHRWHIPFQTIGGNKGRLMAMVDKMMPGDMFDFDPAFGMAHKALTNPAHNLSTKHIIVISDGDPQHNPAVLANFPRDKVTVTTVGVACHGMLEDNKMKTIANATKGRYYSVKNPNQLPAIYIKESRKVSQSFVEEKKFSPNLTFKSGPTEKMNPPPDLLGFVRTTPKASPLVEMPLITPPFADMEFPLLAYWHYGLGKAVAFTSDAGDPRAWSKLWVQGENGQEGIYAKFWEQVIEWSLRPTESSRLTMVTEYRDGKIKVSVEARNDANQPDTTLRLRGAVTLPGGANDAGQKRTLTFVQKNSGYYEAEIRAEDAGSYFITAQATRLVKVKGKDGKEREVEEGVDSVRSGVTLPYSPEFADLESNTVLLDRLREMTGGVSYKDDDRALTEAAETGEVFRQGLPRMRSLLPLWQWLVFLAGVMLFLDIAVRRIAIDFTEARGYAERVWAQLRGRPVPEPERTAFLERLQNRRAPAAEGSERGSRRFAGDAPRGAAPPIADPTRPPPSRPAAAGGPAAPAPPPSPVQPESAEDFAERLRKAKERAWEERKKDGGK